MRFILLSFSNDAKSRGIFLNIAAAAKMAINVQVKHKINNFYDGRVALSGCSVNLNGCENCPRRLKGTEKRKTYQMGHKKRRR